ncbi:hypothetical protein LINGRAHAP2_LOCUS32219, partial [Linum grandiflorum]
MNSPSRLLNITIRRKRFSFSTVNVDVPADSLLSLIDLMPAESPQCQPTLTVCTPSISKVPTRVLRKTRAAKRVVVNSSD